MPLAAADPAPESNAVLLLHAHVGATLKGACHADAWHSKRAMLWTARSTRSSTSFTPQLNLQSTQLFGPRLPDVQVLVRSGIPHCVSQTAYLACRAAAAALADSLQHVYARDKRAKTSESVKAGILETLGLLVEVAPQVC